MVYEEWELFLLCANYQVVVLDSAPRLNHNINIMMYYYIITTYYNTWYSAIYINDSLGVYRYDGTPVVILNNLLN